MYPQGYLLDPEGKNLLSFKRDSMNPMNEGFLELWSSGGLLQSNLDLARDCPREKH